MSLPAEYVEEINMLERDVARSQPKDILQFCANHFYRRLEAQRSEFLIKGHGTHNPGRSIPRDPWGLDGSRDGHRGASESIREETEEEMSSSPTSSFFRNTFAAGPETRTPITPHSPFSPRGAANPFSFDSGAGGTRGNSLSPNSAFGHDMPHNFNMNRRTSVSAESLMPSAASDEWTPPTYPKTEEQMNRLRTAVARNFLFTSLEEDQFTQVLMALNEKPIPAQGTRVITQGDVGDFFYVVDRGTFDVYVNKSGKMESGPNGMGRKVTSVGPGGSFGELALMYNAPRAATIISTVAHAILWSLDRVTFRRILMENTFKRRRMYEAFLEEVPILTALTMAERAKVADVLQTHTFAPGETIICEGDPGDNFYIVESGTADVFKTGVEGILKTYGKGDYFGELALLNDQPRAASIIARTKIKVASLGKDGFVRLLGPAVDIMRRNDPTLKEDVGPLDHMETSGLFDP
ncbi:camp-dependent protein kinase-like protein regulatory subunit [Terfezia claveryi]|nr:camp-dependent protein kinase-like protein regulatory subunit [Terfezia claveryi]